MTGLLDSAAAPTELEAAGPSSLPIERPLNVAMLSNPWSKPDSKSMAASPISAYYYLRSFFLLRDSPPSSAAADLPLLLEALASPSFGLDSFP